MMENKEKHLYSLSELKDYKVESHDHDIRGWKVKDLDNNVVGKVDNLLVNKELGKVVYIDVEVDQSIIDKNHDPYSANNQSDLKEFINKDGENHIIIPIGLIDIHADDKYVYTESVNYQTFAETKRYRSGTDISRNYEHHVLGSYNRDRDDDNKDREIERTRTAYSDDNRTAGNAEGVVDEHYRDKEKAAQSNHSDRRHDENSDLENDNLRQTRERERRENDDSSIGSRRDNRDKDFSNHENEHLMNDDNIRRGHTPSDLDNERRNGNAEGVVDKHYRDKEATSQTSDSDSNAGLEDDNFRQTKERQRRENDDNRFETNRENRSSEKDYSSHQNEHLMNDDNIRRGHTPTDLDDEERIRREKENSNRNSNQSKRPVDDHNRAQDYKDKHTGLHPERSLDEDDTWAHEDRNLENRDDSEKERLRRESEFYSRREFNNRNRR